MMNGKYTRRTGGLDGKVYKVVIASLQDRKCTQSMPVGTGLVSKKAKNFLKLKYVSNESYHGEERRT